MLLFTWVTGPSTRRDKVRPPLQTTPTGVIIAAGVRERPAANIAQGMANQLDILAADRTEILGVSPQDSPAASPAARRIEPIEQPIDALRQPWINGKHHVERDLSKSLRQGAKLKGEAYDSTIKEWPVISAGWGKPSNCSTVGATSMAVP